MVVFLVTAVRHAAVPFNTIIDTECQAGTKESVVELTINNAGIHDTARALYISINAVSRTLKNSLSAGNYTTFAEFIGSPFFEMYEM